MLTASEWARKYPVASKPWLILGKGPTFRKYKPDLAATYNVLALNHVAREVACDVALMMDLDVFEHCGDQIMSNARFVFVPWRPHVNFRPTSETVEDFIARYPGLKQLSKEGRLVVFNAQTNREFPHLASEPVTPIKFFSAEAALNILAASGARNIRTLGLDGGNAYNEKFKDLNSVTLLANGRQDFDAQFRMFNQTLRSYPDLVFGPLNVQTPARIFIGSDPTQVLGAKMFEYSVRRFASMSVTFEIIDNTGLPVPASPQKRARTGFSFCRFKIPELCNYRGRGIYVDADMQVFTDIKDLWTRDFNDAWLLYSELKGGTGRIPQYSVMLLDCANLDWNARQLVTELDEGKYDYASLMTEFAMMPPEKKQPRLEFEWNSLEHYEEGKTKLIHYTDMPTQPWVSHANKNGEVWYAEVRRAVAEGFVTRAEIDDHIARGNISPNLPEWVGLEPYPNAKKLAQEWLPPYKQFAVKPAARV